MKKIKVAIADDHKLFRKGLIAILNTYAEIDDVTEAENGQNLLDEIETKAPDVIFLDLNMPVLNGWDVLKKLQEKKSTSRVIILSMYEEERLIVNAIKNGAVGFLSKNAEPDEIMMAIHSVMESGYYFNDKTNKAMLKKMMAQNTINPIFPMAPVELTEREENVLHLISEEFSNVEIAEKLFLGVRTVEAVRHKLMEKFGAKNSVGLVVSAAKQGFIQL